MKVDAALRAKLIDGIVATLHKDYVLPERVAKIEKRLRQAGRYDRIASPDKLAKQLTADLQETSRDKHMSMIYSDKPLPDELPLDARLPTDLKIEMQAHAGLFNAFFPKVERLPGNIGYVKIDALVHPFVVGPVVAAAMSFVANTDELIIDLRECGGGSPETVALVISYLFEADQPIHLSDIYWRPDGSTRQYWALADVSGRRYVDKPVYVLTSASTFSGGEDLAYTLKALGRAKIVGEVTGGGAHPGRLRKLTPNFGLAVPAGRSINPITEDNWEGVGVKPHVKTTAADALATAHAMALRSQKKRKRPTLAHFSPAFEDEIEKALAKADRPRKKTSRRKK